MNNLDKPANTMTELLFRYVLRTTITKQIEFKIYSIEQIEQGLATLFDVEQYEIVRRERFTGLLDKNGKRIFEDDWLSIAPGYTSLVKFEDGMFVGVYSHPEDGETIPLTDLCVEKCEIIDPELLNQ